MVHRLARTIRQLLHTAPLTATAAILVIALGVGANLAVFAIAYGILWRPLPYPEPARLAILAFAVPDGGRFGISLAEKEAWRQGLRTVDGLAGYRVAELPIRGAGEPRTARVALVTEDFFTILGVRPASGRGETFADPASVVLSARLSAVLAPQAANALLGKTLTIGDRVSTVTAVMPPAFAFPSQQIDAWMPLSAADHAQPQSIDAVLRLAPAVTLVQAADDARRVLREIRQLPAEATLAVKPVLIPLEEVERGAMRPVLAASLAGVVLVLLVTCGNVTMLLLGRAVSRRRAAAVRLALGASWWQLARGPLGEGLFLAACGSLLGLALAHLALRLFAHTAAGVIPGWQAVALDLPVLVLGLAMLVVVTLLCALAPALQTAGTQVSAVLRGGDHGLEPRFHRFLAALVIAQIAASIVLLTGAALLAQTVKRLLAEDAGIEPSQALVVELHRDPPPNELPADAPPDPFVPDLLSRVRALPGVVEAGVGSSLPPSRLPFQIYIRWRSADRDDGQRISVVSATPGFLAALGTSLVKGRFWQDTEPLDPLPLLLSESTARFASPESPGDLIGRELTFRLPPFVKLTSPPWAVGLVRDVKYEGLELPAAAAIYVPWEARPSATSYLAIRTLGEPLALAPTVQGILRQLDPDLPVPAIRTLEQEMARSIRDRRLRVLPALGFAAVALAVALIGVFALLTRAAIERRREFAVRTALGASRQQLVILVLRRAMVLISAGLIVGLGGTALVASGLRGLLYGIGPHDPSTLIVVVLLVAGMGLLAAALPARRAARVEPWKLLRTE